MAILTDLKNEKIIPIETILGIGEGDIKEKGGGGKFDV
jgi:hypothetical protein